MAAIQTLPLGRHATFLPSASHSAVRASGSVCSSYFDSSLPANRIYPKAAIAVPWRRKVRSRRNVSIRAQTNSTALVAKELERVAAKELLLLSIKDAGGLQGLVDPQADAQARIDVNEKILSLERLNPTPRPTTSPLFDGSWEFQFAGATSPGLIAAQALLKGVPPSLASISSLTLVIKDGIAMGTGNLKVLNMVESSFTLTTNLQVEGPVRVKEEYVEGFLATPTMPEGTIPSQLKGVIDQFYEAVNQLPDSMKEIVSSGVKLPLNNTFKRELLISYLDEEVMVARDKSGIPDVLVRVESSATDASTTAIPEYVS